MADIWQTYGRYLADLWQKGVSNSLIATTLSITPSNADNCKSQLCYYNFNLGTVNKSEIL